MARITLEFPEAFIYRTEITVRLTDLNFGGHVGNDQMITLLSAARFTFLDFLGVKEEDIFGLGIVITDLATQYLKETRARETLVFEVGINDINKYGGDFIFRVTNKRTGDRVVLAKTGFVLIDPSNLKVAPMPAEFRELITTKLAELPKL